MYFDGRECDKIEESSIYDINDCNELYFLKGNINIGKVINLAVIAQFVYTISGWARITSINTRRVTKIDSQIFKKAINSHSQILLY